MLAIIGPAFNMSDDDLPILNGDEATPPKSKTNKIASGHPKYVDMVVHAVKELDEKKGASVIAIKQWILQTYPEVDQNRLKGLLRMAVKRGVDSGQIVRPKKSEGMGLLTGRYKLGKLPKPPAKKKVVKKKVTTAAAGSKKSKAASKKDRKQSDRDVFDYEDDGEGSPSGDDNTIPSTPPAKSKSKKTGARPRSASASATPKPRVSKSKVVRLSKSQSPAPTKLKKVKKVATKSPAKQSKSKSPAKKTKAKATASKRSPVSKKVKKPVAKKKTPTKKNAATTKKKTTKAGK